MDQDLVAYEYFLSEEQFKQQTMTIFNAIIHNNLESLQKEIERGADIHALDVSSFIAPDGRKAERNILWGAADLAKSLHREEILDYLLSKGALLGTTIRK